MSLQHFGKATLRVAKNYTKGYSDVQTKVRDATSNDPWGPTGQQMNEIAQMTYNQNDFVEIMEMLDKRLNDKGKNWRHVFKALTVLDYLLHNGSDNVVIYFRDNLYIIKTLKEFQYVDEYGKDQGANVRQKAKDITNLLQDESRLREERKNRASMRDRMLGGSNDPNDVDDENASRRSRIPERRRNNPPDDDEMRKAIEESKRSLAEEQARKAEEDDLARAIKLSEEEEKKRNQSVEETNQRALFDDQAQPAPTPNNPFPLVDPSAQFQQQLQPQYTAMAPQFTSFNPYQQQAQQEAMQAAYMQQQQEWMHQQQEAQQAQLLQAQQQAQQEEWNRQQQMFLQQQQQQQQQQQYQQQMAPQQPLFPQATGFGSNNPFAPSTFGQSPQPAASSASTSSGIDSFSLPSTYANSPAPHTSSPPMRPANSVSPGPSPATSRPTRTDAEHAHLANLLANREDGLDTFGNIGQLRYGHTQAGRLVSQKTGNNPFSQQQQQTSDQPFFSV